MNVDHKPEVYARPAPKAALAEAPREKTVFDLERIRLAEVKRARKAAKLATNWSAQQRAA